MGVYLLRSYCEQKDLFKHVNLPLQHSQGQKQRVVVFDAAGALRSFLRPGKRGLLYDFHYQQSRVRSLVRAFKQAGYELVVFLDLSIPSDKLTTWYRRRVVDAATLRKLNQHLTGQAAKPNLPDSLWIPPNGATQMLGDAFQEAGCRVFYSFDDTDKEAAFWAKKNKAYAVITDDTDFLCYEGVDRIWSANIKLPSSRPLPNKPPQIRVSELQRRQLLSSLSLSQVQLQQLAGLLGNDHIKHIAKDKLQQLRESNPGQHVVSVLAKQVLQLQPQLGGSSAAATAPANGFVAAFGAVLPEVKALVAAVVKAVGGGPAAEPAAATKPAAKANGAAAADVPAGEGAAAAPAASSSSKASVDPVVARLVNRAVAKVVTAAEQGLELEDLTEADLDAFLEGEEFQVSHTAAEEEDGEEGAEGAAAAAAAPAAAAAAAAESSPAAAAASQVERCKRAMAQYSLKGVQAPVSAGSGDRWLLQKRQILMKSVGLEDMSKTPAHVLLRPLRLAVYARLNLASVKEYMCVPDEQWRNWEAGNVVQVPGAPKREKRGGKKAREGRGGAAAADSAQVHPGVKKLVAAAFAKVLGTDKPAAQDSTPAAAAGEDAAAAEGTDAAAATPAADDAAKQDAEETAGAEPAEPTAADDDTAKPTDTPAADAPDADAAAAAAEAPAAAAAEEEGEVPAATDGIEPAVRKLVSSALAKATAAANRAAAKAASALPYEHLPKSLPQKPADVASLLLRRLRQLDPKEEQFSKTQEKLLLLQVTHRNSVLTAMRGAHAQVSAVRLPDLHAANLFLQAYSILHTAADGKLPKITALLHVEAFHALCQHTDLVTKVQSSPSDAEVPKQSSGRGGAPGNMAAAAAAAAAAVAAATSAGRGFRGPKPGMGPIPGGRGIPQPGYGQYPMQQQPRGFRGGRGDAAPGANPGYGYPQQGNAHEHGGFRSRDAHFGGGYGSGRGGYHPAAPVMAGGGGRGGGGYPQGGPPQQWPAPQRPQQPGEALTWQQRQNRGPSTGSTYYSGPPQEGRAAAGSSNGPSQAQWAGSSGYAAGGSAPSRGYGGRGYEGSGGAGGSAGYAQGGYGGAGGREGRDAGGYRGHQGAAAGSGSYGAGSGGYGGSTSNYSGSGGGGYSGSTAAGGYGGGYGAGGYGAGAGGHGGSGSYQQSQGYASGGQHYGGQQYSSQQYGSGGSGGYQQQGYGGQQYGSSSQDTRGGYGGGWGGAGGGRGGAPAAAAAPGGDRGHRPQHHSPVAQTGAGGGGQHGVPQQGGAGLTWQQQQMVRGSGHQPPRGPPTGAMPARQGSGGWQ